MSKEIIIEPSEISIEKEQYGIYSVYASLFDIFAYSNDRLYDVTSALYNNKVFSFSNAGQYVGVNAVKYMPFTYDDGKNNTAWLGCLLESLYNINTQISKDEKITFKINKQKLKDNGVQYNKTLSNALSTQIIEAYLQGLKLYIYNSTMTRYLHLLNKEDMLKITNNKCKHEVVINNNKILFLYNKEV